MKKALRNAVLLCLLFCMGLSQSCLFEDRQKEAKRLYESGLNALDERKRDEALLYFQQAVEKDPSHASAHCRLGQLYLNTDQPALAEIEFRAALREDPGLNEARRSLAWLLYQSGAYPESIPLFKELLANEGKDADTRLALSDALLAIGDVAAGKEMAEKAAEDHPDDIAVQVALARFYENASLFVSAERKLLQLRDDYPDSPQPCIALMEFYMHRGRLEEAAAVGADAVKKGLSDRALYHSLFVLENRRKNYDAALRYLETAAILAPDDPDQWMLLGDYRLFLEMHPQAREVYERITAKWPDSREARTRMAEAYMAEGRYDEAVKYIEGMLAREPDNARVHLLRGLLWIREGDTGKARKAILKALEMDPESAEGYYFYGLSFLKDQKYELSLPEILRSVERNPDSIKARLALAYVYFKIGQFFLSRNELDQILAARPDQPLARALRATVRIRLKDYEAAAFDYRYLIEKGLATPEMPFHLAEIYKAQGKLDQALNVVERALNKTPDSRQGLIEKVRILVAQKAYSEAIDVCDGYLKTEPDDLEFGLLKAGILLKQEKYALAEDILARLIREYPQSYRPLMLMAKTLRKKRRFNNALIYYQRAVDSNPNAIEAYMEMAEAYIHVGQFHKAMDAYEAVLALDATYGPALNDLAYLYADRAENLDRALSLALRAFESMPERPAVRDTLGWAYLRKGSVLLGKTHLAEAVRLSPETALFRYHLGVALHESQDLSGAQKALREAIRLGLEGKELASAQNMLQQMKVEGAT